MAIDVKGNSCTQPDCVAHHCKSTLSWVRSLILLMAAASSECLITSSVGIYCTKKVKMVTAWSSPGCIAWTILNNAIPANLIALKFYYESTDHCGAPPVQAKNVVTGKGKLTTVLGVRE